MQKQIEMTRTGLQQGVYKEESYHGAKQYCKNQLPVSQNAYDTREY